MFRELAIENIGFRRVCSLRNPGAWMRTVEEALALLVAFLQDYRWISRRGLRIFAWIITICAAILLLAAVALSFAV
jgi:hypothetical protein